MGKKRWSQKLLSPTYTESSVLFKHPKGLSFRGAMEREDRSTWGGLGWKDLGVHRGDPLHAAASLSGRKLSGVKFYLRVPFVLSTVPGHPLLCLLLRSCLNSDTWWYYFSRILFSSDILPCKYAGTKPESGKEDVSLSSSKKYTKPEEEAKKRQMYHELNSVDMSQSKWERVAPGTVWQCPGRFLPPGHQI